MAECYRLCFLKNLKTSHLSFSTSSSISNKWRKDQGLVGDPRRFGPLTQLPDYSFVDGRPVPLSKTQWEKKKYQESLCKKIVELCHELDVGLELYNERKKQEKIERETIIKNKLKPKGDALLKNQTNPVES